MNSQLPPRARARLIAGLVVPLALYLILRQAVGASTVALAITEAIPVVWLAAVALIRRQLAPVALVSVVVFGFALAITALSGSSLPLKLRRSVFTGGVGLACLVSVVLGKPLLIAALPVVARLHPERAAAVDQLRRDPTRRRTLTVATVIFGLTFLADAAGQIVLALTVSTTAFVATARVLRLATLAVGGVLLLLYIRSRRRKDRASVEPS